MNFLFGAAALTFSGLALWTAHVVPWFSHDDAMFFLPIIFQALALFLAYGGGAE